MQGVRKYGQRLGAGDLYPLFACMLTARSWDAVNRGIGQTPVTATEVGAPWSWSCPVPKEATGQGRGWSRANPGSESTLVGSGVGVG